MGHQEGDEDSDLRVPHCLLLQHLGPDCISPLSTLTDRGVTQGRLSVRRSKLEHLNPKQGQGWAPRVGGGVRHLNACIKAAGAAQPEGRGPQGWIYPASTPLHTHGNHGNITTPSCQLPGFRQPGLAHLHPAKA